MSDWVKQERSVSGPGGDDWIKAEREHERKMAEIERKQIEEDNRHKRLMAETRTERIQTVAAIFAVAAVVLGIAYFIWNGVTTNDEARRELERACIENGGSWTSLGSSGAESCYYIGNIEGAEQ